MASRNDEAPRLDWHEAVELADWQQGEHVTLIGPTGAGKSVAARALLAERERRAGHVLALRTKPRDRELDRLARVGGYTEIADWPPPRRRRRIVLKPRQGKLSDIGEQQRQARAALDGMWDDGAWTLYVDELFWVANRLQLGQPLRDLWLQGRSLALTLVVCAQRPRNVPVEAYSSSAHLLIWRTNDAEDLKRLQGLGAASNQAVRRTVESLDWRAHEVCWVNTRSGEIAVTTSPMR